MYVMGLLPTQDMIIYIHVWMYQISVNIHEIYMIFKMLPE